MLEMKCKDTKEHSTALKVGGIGLETLRQVSKNFATELFVKYSTVLVCREEDILCSVTRIIT